MAADRPATEPRTDSDLNLREQEWRRQYHAGEATFAEILDRAAEAAPHEHGPMRYATCYAHGHLNTEVRCPDPSHTDADWFTVEGAAPRAEGLDVIERERLLHDEFCEFAGGGMCYRLECSTLDRIRAALTGGIR